MLQEKKMMDRLWGDNFFDPATKKWTNKVGAAAHRQGGAHGVCAGTARRAGMRAWLSLRSAPQRCARIALTSADL